MTTLATKDGLITQSASVPGLVAAVYKTGVGQSIPNAAWTIVNFDAKEIDTHNTVVTGASWRFYAPLQGLYIVSVSVMFSATAAWADGEQGQLTLYKNGAYTAVLDRKDNYGSASAIYMQLSGSTSIYLNAYDYVNVQVYQSSGVDLTLHNVVYFNRIAICRVPS